MQDTQTEAPVLDLDVAPDDPDFQMEFPLSRLDGIMEDIETGRAETFTWEEVKRRGRAARRAYSRSRRELHGVHRLRCEWSKPPATEEQYQQPTSRRGAEWEAQPKTTRKRVNH